MIKRTFIIAIVLILLLFTSGGIIALFSVMRFNNAMSMINIAQESLLQRQRLNEYVIRLQQQNLEPQSLSLIVKEIEGVVSYCRGCHTKEDHNSDEAIFVIERLSMMNSRLRELSQAKTNSNNEIRFILKKMDDLTTGALQKGRELMDRRIKKGVLSIRSVSILTIGLFLAGGIILFGVFWIVRQTLQKNIFSIIKSAEEISMGRDVREIDFSSDFEAVSQAFLKLQSDLRKKEEEIKTIANRAAQTEKLTALGELVAGVSHELNNPLQIIVGYSEMVMSDESVPEHCKTISSRIYESAIRASKIVRNLREFARQREPVREMIDMRLVVDKVIELLDYELTASGIQIRKEYSDIPLISADPSQMQQVILNLFKNAHDAIVETGKNEGTIRVSIYKKDNSLILEISDTGIGMPEDLINRIFEPFFTTKPVGKGTGLGLSITYGIIRQHNGTISVKSKPGEGTTFTIELPIA